MLGAAQAVGAVHTLRQIPEACARLEGTFTGDAAQPYRFAPVRTSEQCQPRARFVDYAKAQPSADKGWKLNDVIVANENTAVSAIWNQFTNPTSPQRQQTGYEFWIYDPAGSFSDRSPTSVSSTSSPSSFNWLRSCSMCSMGDLR